MQYLYDIVYSKYSVPTQPYILYSLSFPFHSPHMLHQLTHKDVFTPSHHTTTCISHIAILKALLHGSARLRNEHALDHREDLGTWKRGAVLLLTAFTLRAPGLAPPLLLAHELNVEAISPDNVRPKTFANDLECELFNQSSLSIEIC